MIRLEETIQVDRLIRDVFRYAADFENIEQWDPGVTESKKLSPGPVGVGTIYRIVSAGRRSKDSGQP